VVTATNNGHSSAELGEYGCFVGGQWIQTGDAIEVHSPYDEALVAIVHRAGPKQIEQAIAAATAAFQVTRKLPAWKRADVLEKISTGIAARREDFARTIALEAGKPIKTARPGRSRDLHLQGSGRGIEAHLRRDRPARLDSWY
jgi:acyl-CoA reductase-like NAD-dependent aldehyde dehydrogenase